MPIIVPDTNVIQIIGGHPNWVDASSECEDDPRFLRLPSWYQAEIRALAAVHLAMPRTHSTAWVPPGQVIRELASASEGPAVDALLGWGGELSAWADRCFWERLTPEEDTAIRHLWDEAMGLDLAFLTDEGDQVVARVGYALKHCHSKVLTIDRKSFWAFRVQLGALGVAVRMPSELWSEMAPYL